MKFEININYLEFTDKKRRVIQFYIISIGEVSEDPKI